MARRAAQRAAAERPLIAAKTVPPELPSGYIGRPRLEMMLGEATARKLTLVTGPPGSGKSAVLAAWAAGREDVAWLSLDEFDNDPAGLCAYLSAALSRVREGVPPRVPPGRPVVAAPLSRAREARLRRVPLRRPVLVAALTGWLSRLDKPVVLIIDNAETLTERPAQAMIAALLRTGLPSLRLVIASRKPLPLQLGQLRLAGEVTEIEPDDLAFTADEAASVASSEATSEVVARTDGLAAAIRLAAEGDNDSLDTFVRSEIFLPLPEQDRDFLLQTSVVTAMSPELAASLTQRIDAGAVLERWRGEGLARWADGGRRRWRIRQPLLDFVRREASLVMGEELGKRHLWAAQWFAERGQPLAAAAHAVLAEDWPLAAEIAVRQAVPELFGANAFELRRILAVLPAPEAVHHPEVAAGIALLRADRGDLDAAEAYTALARKHFAGLPEERATPLRAVLDLVTLMVHQSREDFRAVESVACGLIAQLKGPEGCLAPATLRLSAVALAALGTVRLWAGRIDEARDLLTRAADTGAAEGLDRVTADARGKLAVLHAIRGDITEAAELGASALSLGASALSPVEASALSPVEAGGGEALPGLVGAGGAEALPGRVALGLSCWLRGDNEGALAHLPTGAATSSGKLMVASVRARVLMSQRNMPAARAALAGAQEWVSADRTTALLDDWLATTRAALHLDEGRPINALTALNGALADRDSAVGQQAQILAARAYVASSAAARAVNLIDAARRNGLAPWPQVEAWLVSAVASEQLGREGTARIALAEAVAAADASGLAQPLLDAGPSLRTLMENNRDLLAERGSLTRVDEAEGFKLVEPITQREADVLRYLPTLLRRNDIARELSVSSNTVKAHVRSLYHKLGVGSRRDAVDRARALGLLR